MAFDAEVEKTRPALGITDVQESNLHKLATFLLTLPDDTESFDMSFFAWKDSDTKIYIADECGSVACAVGYGPKIGIKPNPDEEWGRYTERCFLGSFREDLNYKSFLWCFGSQWRNIDNTPQGAAKRILYWLEHGLPEDNESQRFGVAPLCYK